MNPSSNTAIILTAGQVYSILACLLMPLLLTLVVVFMRKCDPATIEVYEWIE